MRWERRILERVLSDTGAVVIHPKARPLLHRHAVKVLVGLEGMVRFPPDSPAWGFHRDLLQQGSHGVLRTIDQDGHDRVLAEITIALRQEGLAPRRRRRRTFETEAHLRSRVLFGAD